MKKAYATLDVVVVGVEWGHGKRRNVLSDYTFAIRDEATGALLPVGKAYSGLTDVEIAHYTEYFLQHTLEDRGRYRCVQPDVVLEVAFDTIQKSDRHASGYALRFPRILRIRDDKPVSEIDTLAFCRELAEAAAAGFEATADGEKRMKATPEIEAKGLRAYEQARAFERLAADAAAGELWRFHADAGGRGDFRLGDGASRDAGVCLAGTVIIGLICAYQWKTLKTRYAENIALLAELEKTYGDDLPWVEVEKHFAALEELQREMAEGN